MGLWRISADVLAGSRFVVSPLAETVASLAAFGGQHATSAAQREWLRAHGPTLRARWGDDPFALPFLHAAIRPGWIADFLVKPPRADDPAFADELARLAATSDADALADIAEEYDRPVPPVLREPGLVGRAVELIAWTWEHTLAGDWPRRRRVLQADVVARTERLSSGGWAAVLEGLRPGMRWLGDGRLQVNTYDYPPRAVTGGRLLFIPTTAPRGWVAWEEPGDTHALVYPCRGWLAEPTTARAPAPLARLLGPVRAEILQLLLDAPKSTTQLVALTGHGLGSVGGHLRVLHDAGLVQRRRSGRSVLYYRTRLGADLAGSPQ
ncbi:winged helix-turn-helix domain-containing protein [Dactylosporangium sp. NPDC005572]|uniref:ArsR/SmtB family transcription factor n=1 Tax=Dactylosporangium sp. NPDC005572 TaxID=3156889 RepID=UPI0033AA087F